MDEILKNVQSVPVVESFFRSYICMLKISKIPRNQIYLGENGKTTQSNYNTALNVAVWSQCNMIHVQRESGGVVTFIHWRDQGA